MSAEVLREASRAIRDEWEWGADGPAGSAWHREREFHLAVADWLDHAAESADLNRSPYVDDHLTAALAVARAYLGEAS